MNRIANVAVVLSTVVVLAGNAEASHRALIYQTANDYRESVREFERQVLRVPYMHRLDERLVDDLEDQTSRLRSAARHPEIESRFIPAWNETQSLQSRVEIAIFGQACYPRNLALERYWQEVLYRFAVMAEQVACLHAHPRYSHPVSQPFLVAPVPTTVQLHRHNTPLGSHVGSSSSVVRLSPTSRSLSPTSRSLSPTSRNLSPSGRSLGVGAPGIPRRVQAIPSPVSVAPSRSVVAPSRSTIAPTQHHIDTRSGSSILVGANLSRRLN